MKVLSRLFSDPSTITCLVTPQFLYCALIAPSQSKSGMFSSSSKQLTLQARTIYPLTSEALSAEVIFNPTIIARHINTFIRTNNLSCPRLAIALSGHFVKQRIIRSRSDTLHLYTQDQEAVETWFWKSHFLFQEDEDFCFYACGLPHTFNLQWQLLALSASCSLTTLTSDAMALFHLYRALQGFTFRESKFADHFTRAHHTAAKLFTRDMLARTLTIKQTIDVRYAQEFSPLLVTCGLFTMERNMLTMPEKIL